MLLGAVMVPRAAAHFVASAPIRVTSTISTERQPAVTWHGDSLVAVWFKGGTPVGWGYSLDRGRTWLNGGTLQVGGPGVLNGPHAVCADSGGRFYLAVRLAQNQRTIATYRGSFSGSSFTWTRLTNAISEIASFGPDHLQLLSEPSGSPLYLIYTEAIGADGTIKLVRSLDRGLTWSAPAALSGNRCNHSRASFGPDGELYIVWLDETLGQILGRKSADQGLSFGPTFVMATVTDNTSPPAGWENNNPTSRDYSACQFDRPLLLSLAVDRSNEPTRGRIYVAWSEYASGTPGPVTGTRGEVEPNGDPASATPMTIGQQVSGRGVGMEPEGDCDWFRFDGQAGQTLWITGTGCGSVNGFPLEEWTYVLWCEGSYGLFPLAGKRIACDGSCPALIYTLPATGRYYLAPNCVTGIDISVSYTIQVRAYQVAAGSVARDHRDVMLVASGDGGTSWSPKVRVNDDVDYDNAMPGVAVDPAGRVHVVWYDRREDPGCSGTVHTRWSWSGDGGASFAASVPLSDTPVDLEAIRGTQKIANAPWVVGDHLAVETIGDEVHAFWSQPVPSDPPGLSPPGDIWSVIIADDGSTATVIAGFRAELQKDAVTLRWQLQDDRAVRGFRVHRAEGPSEAFIPIGSGLIPARGPGQYEANDSDVVPGGRYRYRLEVVLDEGNLWQGPLEVELPSATNVLLWRNAVPNPFTDDVVLELLVPRAGPARIAVFDAAGHEVRRLHRGPLEPGLQAIRWDGRDGKRRVVPAGIYLVRAVIDGETVTRRVARVE